MDMVGDGMTAWTGRVTMHEARWTDKDGSTVTFRLPMTGDAEDRRNPFQRFTKRRKGKAGTRFMMACQRVMAPGTDGVMHACRQAIYEDEVMLAGWNDSQTTGHTVKFWLCNDEMGHPFEGCNRNSDHFLISLVELDEDNQPVNQRMRDKVEQSSKRPSERVSYVAAMLCKNPSFQSYWHDHDPTGWAEAGGEDDPETAARQFILDTLGINSRAELDKSERLADDFHEEIRKPYLAWLEEEPPF